MWPLLLHGIPLVYVSSPLPGAMEQALGRVEHCALPAVPAMWRTWHSAGILDEKIALAISAGAPLPVALEAAIYMDCGLKVHNFYGSSECGGIAYDRSATPRQDAACTGAPMDGVSVSKDEQGHLLVQGPAVATGYLHADSSLSGGIFRTSDTVEIREGLVYLTGRTGDVINVAGRKIAPGGIEEALSAVPGVMHCVVFGVPSADALRGDEIIACLSLRPGVEMSDIRRAAASCLPATQMPRHWWHRPDLAPDVRGKLSRAKWRQSWLDGGGESC